MAIQKPSPSKKWYFASKLASRPLAVRDTLKQYDPSVVLRPNWPGSQLR